MNLRPPWGELPSELRLAIEDRLGSPVVSADSQAGGFSPGTADRVVLGDGRRAFVKAVSAAANPDSPGIHRAEARVLAVLPDGLPVARLLASVEVGPWVALVIEDIVGRHPAQPWRPEELASVLDALAAISAEPVTATMAATLPALDAALAQDFDGWSRLDPGDPLPLPPELAQWCRTHVDDLRRLGAGCPSVLVGDRLQHQDVRADNLLIRPDGRAMVIDWPWAGVGAAWFDALTLLVNVRYYDPAAPIAPLLDHRVFAEMSDGAALRVLTGLAAYFVASACRQAPPNMPTLRAFQRDQGIATLGLVQEFWGD